MEQVWASLEGEGETADRRRDARLITPWTHPLHTADHALNKVRPHPLIETNVYPAHTHTHTLSLSLSLTHTHTLSLTHTHTLSLSQSPTHTHTHTQTHTQLLTALLNVITNFPVMYELLNSDLSTSETTPTSRLLDHMMLSPRYPESQLISSRVVSMVMTSLDTLILLQDKYDLTERLLGQQRAVAMDNG